MFVCICKGITEKQIKASVAEGASSVRDLYRELELGSQCGKCVGFAREVLTSEQAMCDYYDAASFA
ncbi:bacterioferritin-associated ferredoxin [Marinospirillum insulare]|uniref:Bacterioferritin-associated ferredoxin n=1 Tax=Marinospirillum insulare TaxID=217169 RepID=A0ABQ5ZVP5_9GAMM|nr:bacterioferritin-associated ferredoxin [Marinospirillum insulare]GLR64239.1 hypothetical protein GCM10007878_16770 [Marinospirillum insulare]